MSLYDKIGGSAAIHAVVELLYQKLLADESLDTFFQGVEMEEQKRKQRDFLTIAFGGPNTYDGQVFSEADSYLVKITGLNDEHFDTVTGHLQAVLDELNVPIDIANEVMSIAGGTRDASLGRTSGEAAA